MKSETINKWYMKTSNTTISCFSRAYCREAAVINAFLLEKDSILNENGNSLQDECKKELYMDIIPGTAKPPGRKGEVALRNLIYLCWQ